MAPDVRQALLERGGLQIGYQSSPWGGGFTIGFNGDGYGCC